MQTIINKWGNNSKNSIYIFPFTQADDNAWEHEKKKKNLTKNINDRMKKIGEELNIGKITTYVARHSFYFFLIETQRIKECLFNNR